MTEALAVAFVVASGLAVYFATRSGRDQSAGHAWVEEVPVPLVELDLSGVRDLLGNQTSGRIDSIASDAALLARASQRVRLLRMNLAARHLFRAYDTGRFEAEPELLLPHESHDFLAHLLRGFAGAVDTGPWRGALKSAKGEPIHCEIRVRAPAADDWSAITLAVIDESALHDMSAEARERAQLLSSAMTASHGGAWSWSPSGGSVEMSPEHARLLEVDDAATLDGWLNAVDEHDRDRLRSTLMACAMRGEPVDQQYRVPLQDGSVRWVETTGRTVGETGQDLAGFSFDISARAEARQRAEMLSRAIDQSPAGVIITDSDGTIEYANPKMVEISGFALEELIGKNPRVFKTGHTQDDAYGDLWRTISAGRNWTGRVLNRGAHGEWWAELKIAPVVDGDGVVTHFIGLQEDVTERVRLEESLERERQMRIARD